MSKANQARVKELVDGNNKEELAELAEKAGVNATGTKEEIATRIAEAGASDESQSSPSGTGGQESLTVEQRVARLESVVHLNYDQFVNHKHNAAGNVIVSNAAEAAEAEAAPQVDQTKEADIRRQALERRQKHVAAGGNPDDPILDDDEEDDDASNEDTEKK